MKVSGFVTGFLFSFYSLKFLSLILGKKYYERNVTFLLERMGKKLKFLFLKLEGLFIKTGQFLSVAGFFLPEIFKKQLESLQDAATPRAFSEIKQTLWVHFQSPMESYFNKFEEFPIAVASIGQVHRAWLLDDTPVVVKIQHAYIEKIARIDLGIIKKLIALIGWFFKIDGLTFVYEQIEQLILQETDFEKEAKSLTLISANLADEPYWVFPKVFPTLSGRKVLVMSWIDGKKITDKEHFLPDKTDPAVVLNRLWSGFCRMIFQNACYHADPHPGNILLDKNSRICLLDFGAVGTLSPLFKKELPGLILAFASMDTKKLINYLVSLGFIADTPAAESLTLKLAGALNEFLEHDLQQLFDPQGALNEAFWKNPVSSIMMNTRFKEFSGSFRIPKDYILLGRTFSLLLGISLVLRPGENPLKYLLPMFKKYFKDLDTTTWMKQIGIFGKNILSMPNLINDTANQFRSGNSSLKTPDIWRSARLLYILGQQLALLLSSVSLFYMATRNFTGTFGRNPTTLWIALGSLCFLMFLRKWAKGEKLWRNEEI
jgi:predicted unusual protein kinase regulating ubiquinone biosynthesis (AarF/ABC1/UbiB family)